MTPQFHTLRVAEVRRECADAVSVRFDVPEVLRTHYAFRAGQHVALRAVVDGEAIRRTYSICAGEDDGELRVAIRAVPGGRFSTWAVTTLREGDAIEVMTPDGLFFTPLEASNRKHYVAVAAGSGITPILSIAKTTLAREPGSRFTLLYGNRAIASTLFLEAIEDLKNRHLGRFVLHTVFSREHQDVDLFNGRLDAAKIRAFTGTLLPAGDIDEVFVCGPGGMIDEVEGAFVAVGMDPAHVHVERFGIPAGPSTPQTVARARTRATVVVELDGTRRTVEVREDDASLLDAGLRTGLDLPFSCKGGMCCTCRAKVLEGRVAMVKNFSLEPRDVDAGFVLTCQALAETERVVISFDER